MDTVMKTRMSVWNEDVVPVMQGPNGDYYVFARQIWASLGLKTRFTDWFRRYRDFCMLIEGEDYCPVATPEEDYSKMSNEAIEMSHSDKEEPARSYRKEYLLTLEAAKEIALVQRTEKAHVVRRKLLELERQVREERGLTLGDGTGWLSRSGGGGTPSAGDDAAGGLPALPLAPESFAKKAGDLLDAMDRMDARMGAIAGDVAFGRAVADAPDLISATQIAKEYGLSAITFNALLSELKVQYKKGSQWLLYARYEGKGYTRTVYTTIVHRTGEKSIALTTKWTPKGRKFLYDLLASRGIVPGGTLTEKLKWADPYRTEGAEYEDA